MKWAWVAVILLFVSAEALMYKASVHLYTKHPEHITVGILVAAILYPVLTLVIAATRRSRADVNLFGLASSATLMFAVGILIG